MARKFLLSSLVLLSASSALASTDMTCFDNIPERPCRVAALPHYWQSDERIDPDLVKFHEGLCAPTASAMLFKALTYQTQNYKITGWSDTVFSISGPALIRRMAYDKFGYSLNPDAPPAASIDQIADIWNKIGKDFKHLATGANIIAEKRMFPAFNTSDARYLLTNSKRMLVLYTVRPYVKELVSGHDPIKRYEWKKDMTHSGHAVILSGYEIMTDALHIDDPQTAPASDRPNYDRVTFEIKADVMQNGVIVEKFPSTGKVTFLRMFDPNATSAPVDANDGSTTPASAISQEDRGAIVESEIRIVF